MDFITVGDKDSIYCSWVMDLISGDKSGCFLIILTINLKAVNRTDGFLLNFSQKVAQTLNPYYALAKFARRV